MRSALARILRHVAQRCASLAARCEPHPSGFSRHDLAALTANASLRDRHRGRPAFVLGNGRSLARQNLKPLAREVTFVANSFWRHPILDPTAATGWQPTYYAIIDPLYYDGTPATTAWFADLTQRVRAAEFFVLSTQLTHIAGAGLLPGRVLRPTLMQGDPTAGASMTCDLTAPLPELQSVSLLGVLAALFMGCRPVYLLGMDHDWLASPSGYCHHFYPGVSVADHADCRAIEQEGAVPYVENLAALLKLFRSYIKVQAFAQARGVPIVNLTDGGYLDVFPRANYTDVLAALKPAPVPAEAACARGAQLEPAAP